VLTVRCFIFRKAYVEWISKTVNGCLKSDSKCLAFSGMNQSQLYAIYGGLPVTLRNYYSPK